MRITDRGESLFHMCAMVKYRELTDFEKGRLAGMMEAGMAIKSAAQSLNRDRKTIRFWWNKWRMTGNVNATPGRSQ